MNRNLKAANHQPSLIKHIRDIFILPFAVTVIIPYLILHHDQIIIPENFIIKALGILSLAFGIALFSYTVYLFIAFGKGTLAPWAATRRLIIRGPYRYCRNPMITGVLFILIGESLFIRSLNQIIWTVSFFLINTIYFVLKEEPDMSKRFGDEYDEYKKNVPRWIPKVKPYPGKHVDK